MSQGFRKVFIVPHTHWDREWYLPFESYRQWLVTVIDSVIEMLSTGELEKFTLDGQSVPIEDYLEIRPDNEDRFDSLVKMGKLAVGPWYTQPDEWIPSGEALVRNLLYGMRVASAHGRAMRVGYLPDTFGHVATLPTILSQFGLNVFLFYRGLGEEGEELSDEFYWEAPGGERVLAVFIRNGYCWANALGIKDPYSVVFMSAGNEYFFSLKGQGAAQQNSAEAVNKVETLLEREKETRRSASHVILLPNGCDHMSSQRLKPILDALREKLPAFDFRVGTVEDYAQELASDLKEANLKVYRGELRGAKYTMVDYGVLSTRADVKQKNFSAERALTSYSEPLSAIALALGGKPRSQEYAWKLVLRSQAHDSICSTGVDEVNEQVAERLDRAREAAVGSAMADARFISEHLANGGGGEPMFFVFNPVNLHRKELVFVPVTKLEDLPGLPTYEEKQDKGFTGNLITKAFLVRDLPPLGYSFDKPIAGPVPTSIGPTRSGVEGIYGIENEYFAVSAEEDGTLSVLDKASGERTNGFALLVDEGDRGDEYAHDPAEGPIISSKGFLKQREVVRFPDWQELRLSFSMMVPSHVDGRKRSAELVEMPVNAVIRLISGIKRIDIDFKIANTARDHRLRVAFPMPGMERVLCATAFGVVGHPYKELPRGEGWAEVPGDSYAFKGWCAAEGGTGEARRGFMVAAPGAYECWADESPGEGNRSLMVTLYRSVGWLSRSDLSVRRGGAGPDIETPASQLLKELRFRISVIPYTREPAYNEAEAFLSPPLLLRVDGLKEPIPRSASFVEIPPELVLTAFKPSEDGKGLVIRLWNPTAHPLSGELKFAFRVKSAMRSAMDERDGETITPSVDNAYGITVGAGGVETIKLLLRTEK